VPYAGHHIALLGEVTTPRTTTLLLTRVWVDVEHTYVRLVVVENLVYGALLMVARSGDRAEGNAIEAVCKVEHTATYVVQREVLANSLLVELILLLTYLLGIVPPIRLLEGLTWVVLLENLLHILQLALCRLHSRLENLLQESVYSLRVSGHLVGSNIVRV
jgi:hypothetical protein